MNPPAADELQLLQANIENISDGIAILDAEGKLAYVSRSAEQILGRQSEELLGTSFLDRVHEQDREALSGTLKDLVRDQVRGPVECRIEHADGSWRLMEVVGRNLLRPQIRGVVLNLRDMTERRRMEQEVAQLHRLTTLGRLVAQVAHEFNNVLMGIQPMVDVLRRRASDDPQLLRAIDAIHSSVGRGKRITSDILRYGRPAQLALRAVDVEHVVQQAIQEIRPLLRDDVTLDVALSPGLLVHADPAQLAQVLINLALNAKDAMPGGGTLAISASLAHAGDIGALQPFVRFRVRDTGEGIAREHLPYVFEPLFTTKKTGTGLGLSVVHQIVAAHGGHVAVESTRGEGSAFDIFIPAALEDEGVEECPRHAAKLASLRILIVDDEELITSGLQFSLEDEGMEVQVVTRGAAVASAIETFQPDLVLLDLSLPDMDGRTVYAQIADRFGIPVIFSTGHSMESDVEQLLQRPGTAFLMKPYSTEDLLGTMREVMEQRGR